MILDATPSRALAVFAHPDDPEIACAGTLARWASAGCHVHLVIANAGDKGNADAGVTGKRLVAQRAKEAAAAATVMGVADHELLGIPDGEVANTSELRAQLVARVRNVRPDVVIAPDPTAVFFGGTYVNHRDHRELGWAVLDACAPAAGSPRYFPSIGAAHQIETLLLAGTLEPDAWVDIADQLATKTDAVRCHASQLRDELGVVEAFVEARAAEAGALAGVRYAEGFRRISFA